MLFNKLAIIGIGLIGGSLARVLKRESACAHIVGYGRNEAHLKKALDLGVIDSVASDIKHAVSQADMVVVATPLGAHAGLFEELADSLQEGVVVTDVGSAKGSVVSAAQNALGPHVNNFVPGHPIAGTEKSGVEASFAELFEQHLVILTPLPTTNVHALSLVRKMWEAAGADVVTLEVAQHDAVLAATSHLPHVLAYALVDCLAGMPERDEIFQFAAGGFADFSRIASSNPRMWHDICFSNREALLKVLSDFDSHLAGISAAIEKGDSDALLAVFARAKQARDEFAVARSKRGIVNEE